MKKINTKNRKFIIFLSGLFLAVVLAFIYISWVYKSDEYVFETETVKKGSVRNTITATGTLEATNTVTVGTQVSGVIEKLYVDFNSVVKKGQLIAELDKYTLQSSLENSQADLDNKQAEFEYQQANLNRMKELFDKNLLAQSDYDLAVYTYKTSKANLKSAKADLDRAARNLSYATIYSPIDGVVLNRAVEEGQTVTASMNTPELFTITNMLTVMQVEADIDEADIGMVKKGLRVEFTVDAFPNEVFQGKISEVRLQPVEVSNVITYTVIVSAQNPNLMLKPGMTAGITVFINEVNDILIVPGKAIRFKPEREMMKKYMESIPEGERPHRPNPNNMANDRPPQRMHENEMPANMKRMWVKKGEMIRPVMVETGLADGVSVEVISGLKEGDEVVTSMKLGSKSEATEKEEVKKSPFLEQRGGNKGRGPR